MAFDENYMDNLTDARVAALRKSLKPVEPKDLKALGEQMFPFADQPWREAFFTFLRENETETVLHGTTHDGVHILFCPSREKGMWFIPGKGKGPLQPKGIAILKGIVGSGGR